MIRDGLVLSICSYTIEMKKVVSVVVQRMYRVVGPTLFKQNLSAITFNGCKSAIVSAWDGFHTRPCDSDRVGIEKFLYVYFTPECNKQDPGGRSIEVNIPWTPRLRSVSSLSPSI